MLLEGVFVVVNVGNWAESEVECGGDTDLIVFIFGTLDGGDVLRLKGGIKVKIFDSLDAEKLVFFPEEEGDWIDFFDSATASTHGHIVADTLLNGKIYL